MASGASSPAVLGEHVETQVRHRRPATGAVLRSTHSTGRPAVSRASIARRRSITPLLGIASEAS